MQLLIGVPVHNEERHIDAVLAEIRRYGGDIFVVDDGSTDGTPARLAAMAGIEVHSHRVNEGYGQSIIDIFDRAMSGGYDWVITLDADEQHEPSSIREFVRVAAEDDADIISGSRYLRQSLHEGAAPDERRWINCQLTCLLNELTGYGLTDSFCGFKAYRVEDLGKLHLTEKGYSMPLQLWIQAWRAGLLVREIPIKLIYKDPNRRFGGGLDDARRRLRYYLDTIGRELGRHLEPVCDGRRPECPCL